LRRAIRAERAVVAALLGLAGLSWWWTSERMEGMDHGPWTSPGNLGWFLGVWIVMMAAMMLPSAIPAVALYVGLARGRTAVAALFFTSGYLAVWAAIGLVAFAAAGAGGLFTDGVLDWNRGGRWVAGAALLCAAVYQVTPLKDACLARCRTPLGLLLGSWRPGRLGGLRLGLASGAWCAGCCWALMASLFALGVMSIAWTALIAGLIALEKTLPWRRVATGGTTALLLVLGVLLLAAPDLVPGLALPSADPAPMGS
jgi:predicted metal-binding membrane protein